MRCVCSDSNCTPSDRIAPSVSLPLLCKGVVLVIALAAYVFVYLVCGLISNFVGHRRVRSSDLLDAVVRIPLTRLVLVAVRHDGVAVVVLQRPHPVLGNARGAAYLVFDPL